MGHEERARTLEKGFLREGRYRDRETEERTRAAI